MEDHSRSYLYNQDNMAVEMLNKLRNGPTPSFNTVPMPESISQHQTPAGTSLLPATASYSSLNPSLLHQDPPMTHTSTIRDSIMLTAAGSYDHSLTDYIPTQVGHTTSGGVSNVTSVHSGNVPPTVSSSGALVQPPVYTVTLPVPHLPAQNLNSKVTPLHNPTTPIPTTSSETMKITVECSTSDTIIVVGQRDWRCSVCRETFELNSSIDHHLSVKHNLNLNSNKPEENRNVVKEHTVSTAMAQSANKMHPESNKSILVSTCQENVPEKPHNNQMFDSDTNDHCETEDTSFDHNIETEANNACNVDNKSKDIKVDADALPSKLSFVSFERLDDQKPQRIDGPEHCKILAALLAKGETSMTSCGRKDPLIQCIVCDEEIRNHSYYITRHARSHMNVVNYICSVCKQDFYDFKKYREHMNQHGEQYSLDENESLDPNPDVSPERLHYQPATVRCNICCKDKCCCSLDTTKRPQSSAHLTSTCQSQSLLEMRMQSPKHRFTFQCHHCDGKFFSATELLKHSKICKKTGNGSGSAKLSILVHKNSDSSKKKMQPVPAKSKSVGSKKRSTRRKRKATKRKETSAIDNSGHVSDHDGMESDSNDTVVDNDEFSDNTANTKKKKKTEARADTLNETTLQEQASIQRNWTCPICKASVVHTLRSINQHMRELHCKAVKGQVSVGSKKNTSFKSFLKAKQQMERVVKRPVKRDVKPGVKLDLKAYTDSGGICDVCGKVYASKSGLQSHTKTHANPIPKRPCPHCGKIYISKIHLKRHISVVHLGVKDYKFKCDQCTAQFFDSVQLRDHIAYHHKGVQNYICKYCQKGFNCRPTMVRHERKVHTKYFPHKCKYCTQGFPEKSKLVAHEMTHTGTSPYGCDVCGKYFTTGTGLRDHKNLHLGIKPHECGVCGKAYLKNWNMLRHMKKAHQSFEVPGQSMPARSQLQENLIQQQMSQQSMVSMVNQSYMSTADPKYYSGAYVVDHMNM